MLLSDLNVVHNVVTADRLHVSVLHELLIQRHVEGTSAFSVVHFHSPGGIF